MLVTSEFTKQCNLELLDYTPVLGTCDHAAEVYLSPSDIERMIVGILDRNGDHNFLGKENPPLHVAMLMAEQSGMS